MNTEKLREETNLKIILLLSGLVRENMNRNNNDQLSESIVSCADNIIGLLPHLKSEAVEVSDEEIDEELHKSLSSSRENYLQKVGFLKGAKWMRDKQGIAPCKAVEGKKWTDNDVHLFLNEYVNQLSIKQIKINKPICSNTICESINEFLSNKGVDLCVYYKIFIKEEIK